MYLPLGSSSEDRRVQVPPHFDPHIEIVGSAVIAQTLPPLEDIAKGSTAFPGGRVERLKGRVPKHDSRLRGVKRGKIRGAPVKPHQRIHGQIRGQGTRVPEPGIALVIQKTYGKARVDRGLIGIRRRAGDVILS